MEKSILSVSLAVLIAIGLVSMRPATAQTPPPPPPVFHEIDPGPPTSPPSLPKSVQASTHATVQMQIKASSAAATKSSSHHFRDTLPQLVLKLDTLPGEVKRDSIRLAFKIKEEDEQRNTTDARQLKLLHEQLALKTRMLRDSLHHQQLIIAKEYAEKQDEYARRQVELHKLAVDEDYRKGSGNYYVQRIIYDLKQQGLVNSDNPLSFTLDKNGLIVNGKAVPQSVFEEFKRKYLHSDKDHFLYEHHEGNTHTDVIMNR